MSSTSAASPSIHGPLDPDKKQIRIADLEAGISTAPIVCNLRTVSMESKPEYFALSYTWGDANDTVPISVNGTEFQTTRNLEAALRRIRKPDATMPVWADAVCINQQDNEEKSSQVPMMGQIYRSAERVLIYLGCMTDRNDRPHDRTITFFCSLGGQIVVEDEPLDLIDDLFIPRVLSDGPDYHWSNAPDGVKNALSIQPSPLGSKHDALMLLQMLATGRHLYELPIFKVTSSTSTGCSLNLSPAWLKALVILIFILQRPWWCRVWVLQEALLPNDDPLILFDSLEIPFSIFMSAYNQIQHRHHDCCKTLFKDQSTARGPFKLSLTYLYLGLRRLAPFKTIREQRGRLDACDPLYPAHLAFMACPQEASDPRDRVFGLLGFLHDPNNTVKADYGRSTASIFTEASIGDIIRSGNLARLANEMELYGATDDRYLELGHGELPVDHIPSWCCIFHSRLNAYTIEGFIREYNFMVGCGFEKCGLTQSSTFRVQSSPPSIHVAAKSLGIVRAVGRHTGGFSWDTLRASSHVMLKVYLDVAALVRLASQQGFDTNAITPFWDGLRVMYDRLDAARFRQSWRSFFVEDGGFSGRISFDMDGAEQERRMFFTDGGFLGVTACHSVREGDVLFNVERLSCPAILRPAPGPCPKTWYRWVGPAYVPGLKHTGCAMMESDGLQDITLI